jgi:PncC family amidohydrolase
MIFSSEAEFEIACTEKVLEISALAGEKGLSCAAAESLTGGLISSEIVRVPGVSGWFIEGRVTYTDAAKERMLGVSPTTLAEHTAVSRETARAMAEGLLALSGADIAVSATGLAGPGPDELGRPAGLVFIGGALKTGSAVREYHFDGSRLEIRQQAAYAALSLMKALAGAL